MQNELLRRQYQEVCGLLSQMRIEEPSHDEAAQGHFTGSITLLGHVDETKVSTL